MEVCSKCNMPVGEWNEQRRRERFQAAVAAMQGFCGSNILEKVMHSNDGSTKLTVSPNDIASHAINVADALIAELEKSEK